MDPEQWETIRRNHDALKAREGDLMRLLDRAAQALPPSDLQSEIRQAIGLAPLTEGSNR